MNLFFLDTNFQFNIENYFDSHISKMKTEHLQCVIAIHHKLLGLNKTKDITPEYCLNHFSTFPRKHEDGTPFPWALRFDKSGQGKWLLKSRTNVIWILELTGKLIDEHIFRYPNYDYKDFKEVYKWCVENFPYHLLPNIGLTTPSETIPSEYRTNKLDKIEYDDRWENNEFTINDSIQAYRNLYIHGKNYLHKWTNRPVPEFILREIGDDKFYFDNEKNCWKGINYTGGRKIKSNK